jgi:hypothetical protein
MQKWLYALSAVSSVVLLIVYHQLNEVPVDSGDGLAHYFISKNTFTQPSDLLNHWGKPVFTILSSPFAYFGYYIYVFFNILIFALTCAVAGFIFNHFRSNTSYTLFFPLALLGSLDYTSNVLGGLTEVLFGFFLLLSALFLIKKRWLWFAIIIALMPFTRSEGQLLIPIGAIILIYFKASRYILIFLLMFVLFCNLGWAAHDDYWWYFTQNPYQGAAEIYGNGHWTHYLLNWHLHLGVPGLIILATGLILFIKAVIKRHTINKKMILAIYLGAVYFGIIIVHAYLWTYGKNGALGLSRLAIHGLPGILVVSLIFISDFPINKRLKNVLVIGFFGITVRSIYAYPLVYDKPFPKKAMPDERAVIDATSAVLSYIEDHRVEKVYYYHPLVAYRAQVNLKDQRGQFIQQGFSNFESAYKSMNNGDLIIWDSHFAHRDMNFPEKEIARFDEIYVFTPFNQMVHKGNAVAQVKVLRVNKGKKNSLLNQQILVNSTVRIEADSLYVNLPRLKKTGTETRTYQLNIKKRQNNEGQLYFVIQHDLTGQALTFELDNENTWKFSLPSDLLGEFKVYVHNPNGVQGEIELKMALWNQVYK